MMSEPDAQGTKGTQDTRFKAWWRMVGAAVEHASKLYYDGDATNDERKPVSFAQLFDKADAGNEEQMDAAESLKLLYERWRDREFMVSDVEEWLSGGLSGTSLRRGYTNHAGKLDAVSVGRRLGVLHDKPVMTGPAELTLKRRRLGDGFRYRFKQKSLPGLRFV